MVKREGVTWLDGGMYEGWGRGRVACHKLKRSAIPSKTKKSYRHNEFDTYDVP